MGGGAHAQRDPAPIARPCPPPSKAGVSRSLAPHGTERRLPCRRPPYPCRRREARARACWELARWAPARCPDSTPAPQRTQRPTSSTCVAVEATGRVGVGALCWLFTACPTARSAGLQASTGLHAAPAGRVLGRVHVSKASASQVQLGLLPRHDRGPPGSCHHRCSCGAVSSGAGTQPSADLPITTRHSQQRHGGWGKGGHLPLSRGRARCLAGYTLCALLPMPPNRPPPEHLCPQGLRGGPHHTALPGLRGPPALVWEAKAGDPALTATGVSLLLPRVALLLAAQLSPPRRTRVERHCALHALLTCDGSGRQTPLNSQGLVT